MKSVRTQLVVLVAVSVLACLFLTALAEVGDTLSRRSTAQVLDAKDVTADILPPPMYLIELRLVLGMAVDGTLPPDEASTETQRLIREYREREAFWRANPPHGLQSDLLGLQHDTALKLIEASAPVLNAVKAKDAAAAKSALMKVHTAYLDHRAGVNVTVKRAGAFAESSIRELERVQDLISLAELGAFVLATILLSASGFLIGRSIWRASGGEPSAVSAIANEVAEGNLSVQVELQPGDTTSTMAAMQRMCVSLSQLVGGVRASSDAIAAGAQQIASGNLDLSVRTEQQAGNLQQTASAMEQLNGTVQHTADAASQATELSQQASQVAARGASVVQGVVTTMQDITTSSRKIAEITSVIDGIAFQTNILALNAAVEAARAGEQGRGFAVVAAEVRSLAQRSASAAREINGLISSSVQRVDEGARQVQQAGQTMNEIVSQVQRVTDLISEISHATREQTSGIGMVSQAVTQLDGATQQNAALVEESAASAENLKAQAQQLVQIVDVFKVGQGVAA